MANGPQKPDHRGNFFIIPRRVIDNVAWRHLSFRARSILQVFQARHNGFNNGRIALGIHQIAKAIGNQNHKANAKAVAELIGAGFLECVSEADHPQSKAREYRITFISTGEGKNVASATHEYADWRPQSGSRRKFGGSRTAMESGVSVVVAMPSAKVSSTATTRGGVEIRGFSAPACVVVTTPHLSNQSSGSANVSKISGNHLRASRDFSAGVGLDVLRDWMSQVLVMLGHGGQKMLAKEAAVPESVLSKFKAKGTLPPHHLLPLQTACARRIPFNRLRQSAGAVGP